MIVFFALPILFLEKTRLRIFIYCRLEKVIVEKEIYLAGGCFWGTEMYLSNIKGIMKTEVGYANGKTKCPTYEEVCYYNTGHAETVKVVYDEEQISLPYILDLYYDVVNPTAINRQGGDVGIQYRTGIYFVEKRDEEIIRKSIESLQQKYKVKIAIEVLPLSNYYKAEEHHQKYLVKNPKGYCHIGYDKFEKAKRAVDTSIIHSSNFSDNHGKNSLEMEQNKGGKESDSAEKTEFHKKTKEELRNHLTEMQYYVTQNKGTEPPFENEYHDEVGQGIYVDITTGEPIFISSDKFESGCGWPSFAKPMDENLLTHVKDHSHGMMRTEVRSKIGDAHLGHVFEDGPKEMGGLRYCINSASLRFIRKEEMEKEGYGKLIPLVK